MTRTVGACRRVKVLLGAYVLGGLRGQQETQVSAHLAHCGQCRAEYDELAEVPALLDMITRDEAASAGQSAGPASVRGEVAGAPTDAVAECADPAHRLPLRPIR